jgi:hypothetical protein
MSLPINHYWKEIAADAEAKGESLEVRHRLYDMLNDVDQETGKLRRSLWSDFSGLTEERAQWFIDYIEKNEREIKEEIKKRKGEA